MSQGRFGLEMLSLISSGLAHRVVHSGALVLLGREIALPEYEVWLSRLIVVLFKLANEDLRTSPISGSIDGGLLSKASSHRVINLPSSSASTSRADPKSVMTARCSSFTRIFN